MSDDLFTRHDYMHGNLGDKELAWASHRRFYAQFVNDRTIDYVVRWIGGDALLASNDPYLNDVRTLARWDNCARGGMPTAIKFSDVGDYPTLGGLVCVAKEAARQWIERQAA